MQNILNKFKRKYINNESNDKLNLGSLGIELPIFESSWVWLVGAGPGDPGLLTIHALNAIKQADIIVYDALVDPSILELAEDGCELLYAGKRGGKPSKAQKDITDTIINLAKQGKKVLRLKGGDPFVFGRGGEEAIALREAGIKFRIIPGITAGIGGMAYAGIPATHRETNYSLTFVTGHASTGEIPDSLNWKGLATGSQVIVFYMALKHINTIQQNLINSGKSENTPCAIISNASTKNMRCETTILQNLPELAKSFEAPSIIVVGDVVNLKEKIDWLI